MDMAGALSLLMAGLWLTGGVRPAGEAMDVGMMKSSRFMGSCANATLAESFSCLSLDIAAFNASCSCCALKESISKTIRIRQS